jgi:hypothetical protein
MADKAVRRILIALKVAAAKVSSSYRAHANRENTGSTKTLMAGAADEPRQGHRY